MKSQRDRRSGRLPRHGFDGHGCRQQIRVSLDESGARRRRDDVRSGGIDRKFTSERLPFHLPFALEIGEVEIHVSIQLPTRTWSQLPTPKLPIGPSDRVQLRAPRSPCESSKNDGD
jgi:hypothetical protein